MAQVIDIQAEIEKLSNEDFARLREWFAEKDAELWDAQLARDAAVGKLEFLREEALVCSTTKKRMSR